jgi:hypothetical protein
VRGGGAGGGGGVVVVVGDRGVSRACVGSEAGRGGPKPDCFVWLELDSDSTREQSPYIPGPSCIAQYSWPEPKLMALSPANVVGLLGLAGSDHFVGIGRRLQHSNNPRDLYLIFM